MARTALTPVSKAAQTVAVVAGAADVGFVAGDDVNGNYWTPSEGDILLVQNTDVGAQTVTIDAAPDELGRDGAITAYSLAADDIALFGPFGRDGWMQTDNTVHVDVSDATVKLAVFHLR